jgi:amino-acid N-acetyltransferase
MQINIRAATHEDYDTVIAMLRANKLPVEDINNALPHFFVAEANRQIVGAIGLEKYDDYGLLRSMVTDAAYRNRGIASLLVNALFEYASSIGVKETYLLTETAKDYFAKKTFRVIDRNDVPAALKQSAEFSHVCPASAIVMKK